MYSVLVARQFVQMVSDFELTLCYTVKAATHTGELVGN